MQGSGKASSWLGSMAVWVGGLLLGWWFRFGLRQALSRLLRYLGPTRFARLDLGVRFGLAALDTQLTSSRYWCFLLLGDLDWPVRQNAKSPSTVIFNTGNPGIESMCQQGRSAVHAFGKLPLLFVRPG